MELWVEKYRPTKLEEYVWKDAKSRAQVEGWLASGSLPHLLLSGVQGSGKTSLAKMMFKLLNVPNGDVLEINASRERNPDVIANKILGFCSTISMSGMKYILLDEADSMTPLAQRILRGEMENYHEAVRFILTCVTGDTKVYTPYGFKLAENISDDLLLTGSGSKQRNKFLKKTENKNKIVLRTRHGRVIRVTPEHQFKINSAWVEAKNLSVGDRLTVDLGSQYGNQYLYEPTATIVNAFVPWFGTDADKMKTFNAFLADIQSPTDEQFDAFARLCGYLYGDGHLHKNGMHFSGSRPALEKVADDFKTVFPSFTGSVEITHNGPKTSKGLGIHIKSQEIAAIFTNVGIPSGNKVKQVLDVPQLAYESKRFFRKFFQALYDCDGTAVGLSHSNGKTVDYWKMAFNCLEHNSEKIHFVDKCVQLLDMHFGIKAECKTSKSFVDRWQVKDLSPRVNKTLVIPNEGNVLKFFQEIGTYYEPHKYRPDLMGYMEYKNQVSGYKFMTLSQWAEAYGYKDGRIDDVIVEIGNEITDEPVYDCCLSEEHQYVTNGFISHNCNYPNKIIPAIHSRCQGFHFKELDEGEFTTRIANILMNEGVEISTEEDIQILTEYVHHTHPDMRKCINLLQQNTHDGKLNRLMDTSQSQEWIREATDLFLDNKFTEARKLIVEKAQPEEYGDVYRFFYQNLDLWGTTEDQQGCALLAIRQGLVNHGLVSDVEINLAATIAQLMQIRRMT